MRQALAEANHTYDSVDAIAVTQGPGLAGALLVGISYAKALAFALDKPLIAVNHLEGHIHAVLLEERQKGNHELQFPVLALVVSGGHTHLYLAAQNDRFLDLRKYRPHPRRRRWRSLRQSRQAPRPWISRRAGDRPARAAWRPEGREVSSSADQASRPPQAETTASRSSERRSAALRFFLQRNQDGGPALRRVHDMQASIEARRKALAQIAKPTSKTIWPTATSRRSISSRHFNAQSWKIWSEKLWPPPEPTMWPRFSSQEESPPIRNCGRPSNVKAQGRAARLFPFASALDRQCGHDRRRSLSQVSVERFRRTWTSRRRRE